MSDEHKNHLTAPVDGARDKRAWGNIDINRVLFDFKEDFNRKKRGLSRDPADTGDYNFPSRSI